MVFVRGSIDKLFERTDLDKAELARRLGVREGTLYVWERLGSDVPNPGQIRTLYRVAEEYGLNIEFNEKAKVRKMVRSRKKRRLETTGPRKMVRSHKRRYSRNG